MRLESTFVSTNPLSIAQQGMETVTAVPRGLLCLNPHDHDFARIQVKVCLPSLSLSNQDVLLAEGPAPATFAPKMELIVSGSPDRVEIPSLLLDENWKLSLLFS